jgi:hypothetical protein
MGDNNGDFASNRSFTANKESLKLGGQQLPIFSRSLWSRTEPEIVEKFAVSAAQLCIGNSRSSDGSDPISIVHDSTQHGGVSFLTSCQQNFIGLGKQRPTRPKRSIERLEMVHTLF